MLKKVEIFTDGSCLGNPGAGGFAAILRYNNQEKEIKKGFFLTTNNRMELLAAIEALKLLKESCDVTMHSDSQYLKNGITNWIFNWEKNNWKTANKKNVKNQDLWKILISLIKNHQIKWNWIKGHSGHDENERCDILAKHAATNPEFDDLGYINTINL